MPTLRFYFDAFFDAEIEELENKLTSNSIYIRGKTEKLISGFYKKNRIFKRSNNKTQNYLTFENGYINDVHLIKAVDYLKKRIRDSEMYSVSMRRKQTNIDYFQQIA